MSTLKHTDMTKEQLLGELKKMEQRISDLEAPRGKTQERPEASQVAETSFRGLVEQSLFGAYIFQDGRFPYVSPKTAEILGYSTDDIISSMNLDDIICEKDRELVTENIRMIMKDDAKPAGVVCGAKRKDGTIIDIEVQGSRTVFNGKPAVMGTFLDITERKHMEAELTKIRKLESLCAFASGIAHEYNNLLTAIIGNLSLAKMYAKPGYEVYDVLTEAEKASIRAKDLTMQLLTFAEGSRPVKKCLHLGELLKSWVRDALKESRINPDFSIQTNLRPVEADEAQMRRVIDTLAKKALQSTPEGGLIGVRAENVEIDASSGLPLKRGIYVLITIEDHGVGIPEKQLQNLFDPFSAAGQKSGGPDLASSYSIIKMHEGHIAASSRVGIGTTFYIYLPAFQGGVSPSEESMKTYFSGRGTVLVMDDEEIVRLVVSKLLEQCGYEAVLVRDGEEMLKKYREALESGKPFDAVILDLVIEGGMGGQEAIKHLLDMDPQAKALISSGYSNAPAMSRYKEFGFKGFLAKPYRLAELGRVLHEVTVGKEE